MSRMAAAPSPIGARLVLAQRASRLRLRLAMAAVSVAYQAKTDTLDAGTVAALAAQAAPFEDDDAMAGAVRQFCAAWPGVRRRPVALAAQGDALHRAVRAAVAAPRRARSDLDD